METLLTHTFAAKFIGEKNGRKIFRINTKEAKYHQISWKDLGDFGKRKFENIFALTNGGVVTVLYD